MIRKLTNCWCTWVLVVLSGCSGDRAKWPTETSVVSDNNGIPVYELPFSDSIYTQDYPPADSIVRYENSNDHVSSFVQLGYRKGAPAWINAGVGKPSGCTGEYKGVLVKADAAHAEYSFNDYSCGQLDVQLTQGPVGVGRIRLSHTEGYTPCHGAACGFGGELARVGELYRGANAPMNP